MWQQAHVPINLSGPFQVSRLGPPLLIASRLGPAPQELKREACRDGGTFLGDAGKGWEQNLLTTLPCSLIPPQIIFEGVRGSGYLGISP